MASASSVETPTIGLPVASARPLMVLTPIRTPVNEPGPVVHTRRSTRSIVSPVKKKSFSRAGIRTSAWPPLTSR